MKNDLIGEAANLALLLLTLALGIGYARRRVPRAAAWIVPLFVWLSFAWVAGAFSLAHAA